jgi:hypothetical protein
VSARDEVAKPRYGGGMKKPPPEKTPPPEPTPEQIVKILDFMANPDGAEQASRPEAPETDSNAFWASGNPKIVIKDQPGLALAITAAGDLLLRQHAEPRDTVIIVTRHFLPQFLEDVCSLLGVRPQLWSPKK